jgi:NADH-quinone oxidoreductase subunit C
MVTASSQNLPTEASALFAGLRGRFSEDILAIHPLRGLLGRVEVRPGAILPICRYLRDEEAFAHCAMVGGVDWRETREVVYHLWSDQRKAYLELSLKVPASDPHVESVAGIWPGANWHEREAWDLLGIRFDHHPDLRRIFLPEGYEFHPLLKTFELHEPEALEVKTRHE